jgi:hypothetical protein
MLASPSEKHCADISTLIQRDCLRLNEPGWGAKRIARELGISRNTAKEYIAAGKPRYRASRHPLQHNGPVNPTPIHPAFVDGQLARSAWASNH